MRRVLFVNRYFHPDHSATSQMLSDLAFHLAVRGWPVEVITSRQRYDDASARLPAEETVQGVRIHRVMTSRFGRGFLPGRALDYATFYLAAFFSLLHHSDRQTIIVAKTDPPLVSVVAASVALFTGSKLVNWIQDLFPEVAESLGVTRRVGMLRRLRNWSLRRASTNVAISEEMAARLAMTNVEVRENWADAGINPCDRDENPLRTAWQLNDAFVVGYSGNLGRAHDGAALLESMRALPAVTFLVIGGGAQSAGLRQDAAALPNVRFEPYQPREMLSQSLSAADVHLVTLLPSLEGLIVPSKIYGILAAGRPAIYIGSPDSTIGRLLLENECGLVADPDQAGSLPWCIAKLAQNQSLAGSMGRRGRALYERRFTPTIAFAEWERILSAVK